MSLNSRKLLYKDAPEPDHWDTPCALCGKTEGEHAFGDWACPTGDGPKNRKFTKRYSFIPRKVRP